MGRPSSKKKPKTSSSASISPEIDDRGEILNLQSPIHPHHRSHSIKSPNQTCTSGSIEPCHTQETDCYNLLVAGDLPSPHFYQSSQWNSIPPSSWLSFDYSFSYSSISNSNQKEETSPLNNSSSSSYPCSLEEQLFQIQKELNEIKIQLGPASIQYSESSSSFTHQGRGRKRKLTPQDVFSQVRACCNPFESIGQQLLLRNNNHPHSSSSSSRKQFVCRSALKLANIHALLRPFPFIPETKQSTKKKDPFVFVDLCGAPGGFSEYILSRFACIHKTLDPSICQGFGMSLQGSNADGEGLTWDLDHITKNYPDARHCFHIVNGSDGTGDVYNWNNVQFLRQVILTSLAGSTAPESRGRNEESLCSSNGLVDLVVADGGFEAQRDSECQEDITSKLIVCQVAAGLSLLKPGGNFCVKMFGFQTATSQNVLAMLCHCFDRISILKPIASRPASAERYVVGIGRNPHVAFSLEECENFLQSGFQSSFSKPSIPHSTLTNFLLSFERDLLLLNTKACKHILTVFKAEDESLFLSGQHPSTNLKNQLKAYKMSWLL